MRVIPSHGPHCVGCGDGNPASLGLRFSVDADDHVHTTMRLDERHQGAPGFAHGGMIATALDDTLGTLLVVHKRPAVTASLTVDYRRPAFIHTDYAVEAWIAGVDGRKLDMRGVIRDADGTVIAEAHALFLEVSIAHFEQNGNGMPDHVVEHWRKGDPELPYYMAAPEPSTKRTQIQAAVLTATEQLLAEGTPFAELNIERIASAAGISRTAFYFYFRDKRELLVRLTEGIADALFEAGDAWFSGDGDPDVDLERGLHTVAQLYVEHDVMLRVIVEVSTYDEELAQFWRSILQRFADATTRRIESEQAAGRCAAIPAAATAFSLVWMCERTFYQRLVQDTGISVEDTVTALVGIWRRAIYSS